MSSSIRKLPEVVAAVNGRCPVLVDGGIRRGTDVFKALALGADAVLVGRPYVWGLGAFGQPGVERVLELLRTELRAAMQQAGAPTEYHGLRSAYFITTDLALNNMRQDLLALYDAIYERLAVDSGTRVNVA